eukprot:scaffold8880_cov107-Skeletonema_dohrnii-CCMP3373.AAC.3
MVVQNGAGSVGVTQTIHLLMVNHRGEKGGFGFLARRPFCPFKAFGYVRRQEEPASPPPCT